MKKLILLLVVVTMAIGLNSCSSDDTSPSGTVTFKLDGVQKTLKIISVNEYKNLAGTANEYTQISVYASSRTEDGAVEFSFKKGDVGNIISNFTYIVGGDVGYLNSNDFLGTVTANDDKKLIGTFSGHVGSIDGTDSSDLNITEGSFDIQY